MTTTRTLVARRLLERAFWDSRRALCADELCRRDRAVVTAAR